MFDPREESQSDKVNKFMIFSRFENSGCHRAKCGLFISLKVLVSDPRTYTGAWILTLRLGPKIMQALHEYCHVVFESE